MPTTSLSAVLASYDFAGHRWDHGGSMNPVCVEDCKAMVHELADGLARGEKWQATTDGGWPRVGWKDVISVEMLPRDGQSSRA